MTIYCFCLKITNAKTFRKCAEKNNLWTQNTLPNIKILTKYFLTNAFMKSSIQVESKLLLTKVRLQNMLIRET